MRMRVWLNNWLACIIPTMAENSGQQFDDSWDSRNDFDAIVNVDLEDSHADGTSTGASTDVDINITASQVVDRADDGDTSNTTSTAPASGKYSESYMFR